MKPEYQSKGDTVVPWVALISAGIGLAWVLFAWWGN